MEFLHEGLERSGSGFWDKSYEVVVIWEDSPGFEIPAEFFGLLEQSSGEGGELFGSIEEL